MKLSARLALLFVLGSALAPASALAQYDRYSHRSKEREWQTIAAGSAVLGAIGWAERDKALATLGAAGAVYSSMRAEDERRAQHRDDRWRDRDDRWRDNGDDRWRDDRDDRWRDDRRRDGDWRDDRGRQDDRWRRDHRHDRDRDCDDRRDGRRGRGDAYDRWRLRD